VDEKGNGGENAPLDVGWFSHEEPFAMDIRDFRYAEGAARFWGGTPSVAPYAVAAAGLEVLHEAGVPAICAHNQRLLTRLLEALPRGALASHGKEGERGSSALIAVPDLAAASRVLTSACPCIFTIRTRTLMRFLRPSSQSCRTAPRGV
jgi:kynureninase